MINNSNSTPLGPNERPFNLEHAKNGAKYGFAKGSPLAVRILAWDRQTPTSFHVVGLVQNAYVNDGEFVAYWDRNGVPEHPHLFPNLVMKPLNFVEDKPVFAGDTLWYKSGPPNTRKFTVTPTHVVWGTVTWEDPNKTFIFKDRVIKPDSILYRNPDVHVNKYKTWTKCSASNITHIGRSVYDILTDPNTSNLIKDWYQWTPEEFQFKGAPISENTMLWWNKRKGDGVTPTDGWVQVRLSDIDIGGCSHFDWITIHKASEYYSWEKPKVKVQKYQAMFKQTGYLNLVHLGSSVYSSSEVCEEENKHIDTFIRAIPTIMIEE